MAEVRRVPPRRDSRRSHVGLVVSGALIVLAGFAVGVVEILGLPRGSIWVVVAITAALVGTIRAMTRSR